MDNSPFDGIEEYLQRESPGFLHAIPVTGVERHSDAGRLVVTALEIWTSRVVVHSTEVKPVPSRLELYGPAYPEGATEDEKHLVMHDMAERMRREHQNELADDAGTAYPWAGASGGGGGRDILMTSWRHSYFGTIPDRATKLLWWFGRFTDREPVEISLR